MRQRESELKRECRKLLELNGFRVYPQKAVSFVKDKTGKLVPRRVAERDKFVPDLLCCSPNGRFVGIEVKADASKFPRTKREREQKKHLEGIYNQGGVALVIDSIKELEIEIEKIEDENYLKCVNCGAVLYIGKGG